MADAHGTGADGSFAGKPKRSTGLIIGLVVAIVVAVVAAGFAFYQKQQVSEWENAAQDALTQLEAAGLQLEGTADTVVEYESQVADLSAQVADLEKQAQTSGSNQAQTEQDLADAQAELASTQRQLKRTEAELADTQAQLLDAQTQLAQVGEIVLRDGTYVGPILGAKTNPRVIIFNASGNFRVAEVATDAKITTGGSERTLQQLGRILASTDPAQAELANGNYQVVVRNGLVTSIRKSPASA